MGVRDERSTESARKEIDMSIDELHPGFELVGPIGELMIELKNTGLSNASEHRRAILARVPRCVVGEWWSDTSGPVWRNEGYVGDEDDMHPRDRSEWIAALRRIEKHVSSARITVQWPSPHPHAACVAIGMGLRRSGSEIDASIAKLEEWIDKCRMVSLDLVEVINAAGATIYTPDRIEHSLVASYGFEHVGMEYLATFTGED